jgi:hypothetical protein
MMTFPWIGNVELQLDRGQVETAWALYVEFVTRIENEELPADLGSDREALNSLYQLFAITRSVLREAGPKAIRGNKSVGYIAISILNFGLRPFLSYWHPLLQTHESKRPADAGVVAWERDWPEHEEFRHALIEQQRALKVYVSQLKAIIDACWCSE